MLSIAFDEELFLYYEGRGGHGRALEPAPFMSIATLIADAKDLTRIPNSPFLNSAPMVFREDSFDPVTRIRRGRIYKQGQGQPQTWQVQPHPLIYSDQFARGKGGFLKKSVNAFDSFRLEAAFMSLRDPMIALGIKEAYTLWRIVGIERITTNEDLLILRARTSLGLLPELDISAVPEEGRTKLLETVDRLLNSAHRAGPEDVIESARAVAQWSIGTWLAREKGDPKIMEKDLGELATQLEARSSRRAIVRLCQRLHSLAKPNEQEKLDLRPVHEGDAEVALAAIGLLFRELRWAK